MAEAEMDRITRELLRDNKSATVMSIDQAAKMMNEFKTTYLLLYNILLFFGHLYLFAELTIGFATNGTAYISEFWPRVCGRAFVCTALQYFDLLHSFCGLTKTGYQAAAIQVTGRLVMLSIISGCPELHTAYTTYCLLVVWFLIELFRYPYYALTVKNVNIYIVTWLRYSVWIPLYPTGLCLEAVTILRSIPHYYHHSDRYGFSLPNSANIGVNLGIILAIFLTFGFLPIAIVLVGHMRSQRKKKMADLDKKKN